MRQKFSIITFITVSLLTLYSARVMAQSMSQSGVINGTIEDFMGARVPEAPVEFENEDGKRRVASDAAGEFRIILTAGRYLVTVNHSFFYPFKLRRYTVKAGKTQKVTVVLRYDAKKHPPVMSGLKFSRNC